VLSHLFWHFASVHPLEEAHPVLVVIVVAVIVVAVFVRVVLVPVLLTKVLLNLVLVAERLLSVVLL
jgi:hypothetical protein